MSESVMDIRNWGLDYLQKVLDEEIVNYPCDWKDSCMNPDNPESVWNAPEYKLYPPNDIMNLDADDKKFCKENGIDERKYLALLSFTKKFLQEELKKPSLLLEIFKSELCHSNQ